MKNTRIEMKQSSKRVRGFPKRHSMQENRLTLKQKLFCELYVKSKECFSNATQAYVRAYDMDESRPGYRKVAQASSSRLLSNVIISREILGIFAQSGLTDEDIDKQHLFLVMQFVDFRSKMRAIEHYNKITGRIKRMKIEREEAEMKDRLDKLKKFVREHPMS